MLSAEMLAKARYRDELRDEIALAEKANDPGNVRFLKAEDAANEKAILAITPTSTADVVLKLALFAETLMGQRKTKSHVDVRVLRQSAIAALEAWTVFNPVTR